MDGEDAVYRGEEDRMRQSFGWGGERKISTWEAVFQK